MKKLVLFGAGKIGRSFIGQLFSQGGYEVIFVDIYKPVIEELNRRRNYEVVIKSDVEQILIIKNVRGICVEDDLLVINEIANADILAVSIGQNGLPTIMPLIAKGLLLRLELHGKMPLDIIIAENLRNAAEFFRCELLKYLPENYLIDELLGLVETSIGKMVPIMLKKDMESDILKVFAEPYNNLILDKKGFKNQIPQIKGLSPKENIKAWVDRKLFIHNLGHATTAYLGFYHNSNFVFLYEAMSVPEILSTVRETMLEAAEILLNKYPNEFTLNDLIDHIDDLISRFQNKSLGDTIYRVGSDLKRKLGKDDRLSGVLHMALKLNLPYNKILTVLVIGCHFKAKDEMGRRLENDIDFEKLAEKGLNFILTTICGFDAVLHGELILRAEEIELDIRNPHFRYFK